MNINETIKQIRGYLKKRSGRSWSVTRGTGTAYGWLRIESLPKHLVNGGMTEEDRQLLKKLLDIDKCGYNGITIPSANDYYAEYISRAKGEKPTVYGQRYWD